MLMQVEGYQRQEHREIFDKMFRQRKLVFHDQKQWDVKLVDEQYEIDEYDRDDTCYLISLDRRREVVGSLRLISTATPHMMSGPFRTMFPDVDFRSPLIWEVTRFVVLGDHSVQANQISTAACELLLGACQFGLRNGVRHMTSVYESGMLRLYRRCGLPNPELARHRTEKHGSISVGLWEVCEELEASILAATGLGERFGEDRQTQRAA
ncbi:MAG TPA: acyl-homoserine-lactone synthase [Roseiarcus sp.]|nr:acyl-homoserine-lactone synthase [Roseiarcus sp.]